MPEPRTTRRAGGLAGHVQDAARPITGPDDYNELVEAMGSARVVLIGEASHGTDEFYRERALLTRRLITEHGFNAVAAEADWPDAYRVNAYVRARSSARNADAALDGFKRFPTWMWRNTVVLEFIEWLRAHNEAQTIGAPQAGFYGIDLYSLYASVEAVIDYLERVDPAAAARARYRYGCFEDAGEDPQAYGYAASIDATRSCEEEAVAQLLELQSRAEEYARRDGRVAEDDLFYAEQNARVVRDAEEYYRSMFHGRVSTWNLRDRHMAETLRDLLAHLDDQVGGGAKVVVWAHNSHIGDARATGMGRGGELNIGQLAREAYGVLAFNVGFTTYDGTVTAARDWGDEPERRMVRPALAGSYEALFHEVGEPRFLLHLRGSDLLRGEDLLERAIGVIYRPETERLSHYFRADIAEQFDAVLHIDRTTALEPLERTPQWMEGEAPETYPFAV